MEHKERMAWRSLPDCPQTVTVTLIFTPCVPGSAFYILTVIRKLQREHETGPPASFVKPAPSLKRLPWLPIAYKTRNVPSVGI